MENKKLYCDLHTHSTRSDSELSRAEVIEEAIKNDIGLLAISDHNIPFDDLDELQTRYPDIKLINGSEVSTSYMVPDTDELREIHVVALDFENTEHFVSMLRRNRYDSEDYVTSIIQKLREAGLEANFTYSDLRKEMNQEFIGRMAVARKMIALGLAKDVEEVFDEYIGDFGKRHFKFCGGMAMETLYATYTPGQQEQLKAYADEYGLMQSAASDFHGRGKKGSLANQFPISYAEHLLSIRKEDRKIKEQDG